MHTCKNRRSSEPIPRFGSNQSNEIQPKNDPIFLRKFETIFADCTRFPVFHALSHRIASHIAAENLPKREQFSLRLLLLHSVFLRRLNMYHVLFVCMRAPCVSHARMYAHCRRTLRFFSACFPCSFSFCLFSSSAR